MNIKLVVFLSVLTIPILSCEKDGDDSISIHGEWQWVQSSGYWGTRTPDQEGYEEVLKFDAFFLTRFRNGGIVEKQQYDIIEKTYTSGEVYYVIHFDSGLEYILNLEEGQLRFSEFQWTCGYDHYYLRKF